MANPIYDPLADPAMIAGDNDTSLPLGRRGLHRVMVIEETIAANGFPKILKKAFLLRRLLTAQDRHFSAYKHGAAAAAMPAVSGVDQYGRNLRPLAAGGYVDESLEPMRDVAYPDGDEEVKPGQRGIILPGTYADGEKRIFMPMGGEMCAHHRESYDPQASSEIYDVHDGAKGIRAGLHKAFYVTDIDEFLPELKVLLTGPNRYSAANHLRGHATGLNPNAYQGWAPPKPGRFQIVTPDGKGGLIPTNGPPNLIRRPFWGNYNPFGYGAIVKIGVFRWNTGANRFTASGGGGGLTNSAQGVSTGSGVGGTTTPSGVILPPTFAGMFEVPPTGALFTMLGGKLPATLQLQEDYRRLNKEGYSTIALNWTSGSGKRAGYGMALSEPSFMVTERRATRNTSAKEPRQYTLGTLAERSNGPFFSGAKGDKPHQMGVSADGLPIFPMVLSREFAKFGPGPNDTPSAPLAFLEEFVRKEMSFPYVTACYVRYDPQATHKHITPDGVKLVAGQWAIQSTTAWDPPGDDDAIGIPYLNLPPDGEVGGAEGGAGGGIIGGGSGPSDFDPTSGKPMTTNYQVSFPSLRFKVPYARMAKEKGIYSGHELPEETIQEFRDQPYSEAVITTIGKQGSIRKGVADSAMVFHGADIAPHELDSDKESQFTPKLVFRPEAVVGFGTPDACGNVTDGFAIEVDHANKVINLQGKDEDGVDTSEEWILQVDGAAVGGGSGLTVRDPDVTTTGDHAVNFGDYIYVSYAGIEGDDINLNLPAITEDEDVGKKVFVYVGDLAGGNTLNVNADSAASNKILDAGSQVDKWLTTDGASRNRIELMALHSREWDVCCSFGGSYA